MGIVAHSDNPDRRGVVVIQIDGLSYDRMQRAMAGRKLPFLRKLVKRGKYRAHRFLSEIPTSTPAFQAGFFYGDNDDIPGFRFYDKREKRLYRMGDSECAYSIEKSKQGPGLLADGSVMSCVYTGGADASMFVFSTMLAPRRWRFVLRAWDIFMLTLLNLMLILKVVGLAIVEFFVALWDALPWIFRRGWIKRELTMIVVRVTLMVVAREMITLGAIIDIFRGVPVIFLNYLGYDEQAHSRGPDSPVAKWALRGIDRDIRRIYKATRYAERRYDVYILSDHGQCASQPFEMVADETLGEFVEGQLAGVVVNNFLSSDSRTTQMLKAMEGLHRIAPAMPRIFRPPMRWYANYLYRHLPGPSEEVEKIESLLDMLVVSTGPIAYLYWTKIDHSLTIDEIESLHPGFLDNLANHPGIGFVSVRAGNDTVLVRGRHGQVIIGESGIVSRKGQVPFDNSIEPEHVIRGVRRITLMDRAGDVCIWGGGAEAGDISYTFEFGAHSGWTDDEISAFILAPAHVKCDFSRIRTHSEFFRFFERKYLRRTEQEPPADTESPKANRIAAQ